MTFMVDLTSQCSHQRQESLYPTPQGVECWIHCHTASFQTVLSTPDLVSSAVPAEIANIIQEVHFCSKVLYTYNSNWNKFFVSSRIQRTVNIIIII